MLVTAFESWASELLGAIVGGSIAGVVAWFLLKKTQQGEASARAAERREAAALSLIPAIMNTVDAATKSRAGLEGRFPLFELRNQIALAEGALIRTDAIEQLHEFYMTLSKLRRWLRDAPAEARDQLTDPRFSIPPELERHFGALNEWSQRLVALLHATYDSQASAEYNKPDIPGLPTYGPPVGSA